MRIKIETIVGFFIILSLSVFLFLSFKIGIWRLNTIKQAHYIAYFQDVSGLNENSDVVIAGVKIGWVKNLILVNRNKQVKIDMMIDRNSIIYSNAIAVIRQNGILGTKYIEIIPGDSSYPILSNGSTLLQPTKTPVSIDEILSTFKEIADNVNKVTLSLKEVISDEKNKKSLTAMINDAQKAFKAIEVVANSTNFIIEKNNKKINNLISDFSITIAEIKNNTPSLISNIKDGSIKITNSITNAGNIISQTASPIQNIAKKIDNGKGVLGSLVNDDQLLKEMKITVESMKKYFSYFDRLGIDVDTHVESMQGRGNDLDFKDSKGYFNFLVRPSEDFYYILGLTSSYAGVIKRYRTDKIWADQEKHEIIPNNLQLDDWAKLKFAPVKEKYVREYSALTFNLQFAKEFGNLICRAGLFESSFGFGLDYEISLKENLKWITTFELFKFNEFMSQTVGGRINFDIDMPHLKWYNKVFVNDTCYFTFGADDFISKFNKNFFVGMGLLFEQDDLKYLSSKISLNS